MFLCFVFFLFVLLVCCFILVLSNIFYLSETNDLKLDHFLITICIFLLFLIYLFNFFGLMFLGDSGERVRVRLHSSRCTTTYTSSTSTKLLQRSCHLIVVLSKCRCIRTTELCNGLLDGLEATSAILPWES